MSGQITGLLFCSSLLADIGAVLDSSGTPAAYVKTLDKEFQKAFSTELARLPLDELSRDKAPRRLDRRLLREASSSTEERTPVKDEISELLARISRPRSPNEGVSTTSGPQLLSDQMLQRLNYGEDKTAETLKPTRDSLSLAGTSRTAGGVSAIEAEHVMEEHEAFSRGTIPSHVSSSGASAWRSAGLAWRNGRLGALSGDPSANTPPRSKLEDLLNEIERQRRAAKEPKILWNAPPEVAHVARDDLISKLPKNFWKQTSGNTMEATTSPSPPANASRDDVIIEEGSPEDKLASQSSIQRQMEVEVGTRKVEKLQWVAPVWQSPVIAYAFAAATESLMKKLEIWEEREASSREEFLAHVKRESATLQ